MSAHTPTPWRICPDHPHCIQALTGREIGSTFDSDFVETVEVANAALIVRAVNTHEALVVALKKVAQPIPLPNDVAQRDLADYYLRDAAQRMAEARAALALVEGRTP